MSALPAAEAQGGFPVSLTGIQLLRLVSAMSRSHVLCVTELGQSVSPLKQTSGEQDVGKMKGTDDNESVCDMLCRPGCRDPPDARQVSSHGPREPSVHYQILRKMNPWKQAHQMGRQLPHLGTLAPQ